jgi:hypothetical protein
MNLAETIKVNRQIMQLISSKYPELFPAAYNHLDARYYRALLRDTTHAEQAMKHGGLALPPEEA